MRFFKSHVAPVVLLFVAENVAILHFFMLWPLDRSKKSVQQLYSGLHQLLQDNEPQGLQSNVVITLGQFQ